MGSLTALEHPIGTLARLDGGVSDTPLYDATLSDVLARVRWEADARVASSAEVVRDAQRRATVAENKAQALEQRLLAAAVDLERTRREAMIREAILRDQVEDAVRAELVAAAPPLLDLRLDEDEPVAPPIPSFDSLRTSGKRLDAFFDSLIGP